MSEKYCRSSRYRAVYFTYFSNPYKFSLNIPLIPSRQREIRSVEHKLWGQDTRQASNGDELAYNHFKASHYVNGPEHSKVVVSHRHHGSRTYNMYVYYNMIYRTIRNIIGQL